MAEVKTMRVKAEGFDDPIVINESDFDKERHELFTESRSGKLPEDFPGFSALADAGIHTYAQLRKAGDVTNVPGIGDATAAKIAVALAE